MSGTHGEASRRTVGASSADDSEAFNAWGELIRRARVAPLAAAS